MTKRPRKLAIIAPNWLGDAVMSLPLVAEVGGDPGVTVCVVASPYTARVYAGVAGVDEIAVDGARGRWGRIRRRARALRALGVDAAVILPPSFSSALAPYAAGVRVRVAHASDGRRALLTHACAAPARGDEHLSRDYAALGVRALEVLGIPGPAETRLAAPALRVFESDSREARGILDGFGVGRGSYAAVVPGATYGPAKAWPRDRFREAAESLSRQLPVLLLGGGAERGLCARVAEGLRGVHNAAGSTTLGGFFALVAGAGVLVANDSGAPHAAAALGVPVVVLFGSTSPEWTRPIGDDVTVVRHPVHCAPCFRRNCPTQLECFSGISSAEVVAAALDALERSERKKEVAASPAHR